MLVAFIQYSQRFFRPIQDLSDKYNILQAAMAASERVFKLLDTPPEIVSPVDAHRRWFRTASNFGMCGSPISGSMPPMAERLRESTTPENEPMEWVLRDVSFTIEPGETAAIVGHTGAGKTTLSSLMMRFYDVQRGAILIEGVDIRDLGCAGATPSFRRGAAGSSAVYRNRDHNIRLGTERITDERD